VEEAVLVDEDQGGQDGRDDALRQLLLVGRVDFVDLMVVR
jgi:hypothetical protein